MVPPDMQPTVSVQDLFGIWSSVEGHVTCKLPLKNVEWQRKGGLMNLPELSPRLCAFDIDHQGEFSKDNLMSNPLLNMLVVRCDDLDTYKDHVKGLVRNWHNLVAQRQPAQQWLILHVLETEPNFGASGGPRVSAAKFLGTKNSVLDKIRLDFDAGQPDQCVQIRTGDGKIETDAAYNNLLSHMADLLLSAIDARITLLEDDLDRPKTAQVSIPRHFSEHFRRQFSLANTFEILKIHGIALEKYDELDKLWHNYLMNNHDSTHNRGLNDFDLSKFTTTLPVIASAFYPSGMPSLEAHSPLEITFYIYSSQTSLLLECGLYVDILTRGLAFLSMVERILRAEEVVRVNVFLYLLATCILISIPDDCYSVPLAAARGDIVHYQLSVFRKLQDKFGFLHDPEKGETVLLPLGSEEALQGTVLRPLLVDAPVSIAHASLLTERILTDHKFASRIHSILRIHMELMKQRKPAVSLSRVHEIARSLSNTRTWHPLNEDFNRIYLQYLSDGVDGEAYVQTGLQLLVHTRARTIADELVIDIQEVLKQLPNVVRLPLHEYGAITIPRHAIVCSSPSGIVIQVKYESFFSVPVKIDDMVLSIGGDHESRYDLKSGSVVIRPGLNVITVESRVDCIYTAVTRLADILQISFSGQFMPIALVAVWQRVSLVETEFPASSRILICRSLSSPHLELQHPRLRRLGAPRQLSIDIYAGEDALENCKLYVGKVCRAVRLSTELQLVSQKFMVQFAE